MTSLARLFTVLLAFAGVTSCGGAAAADWQTLDLPGVGNLRVRHAHRISSADTARITASAQTLVDWTKSNAWDRLRVMVDDKHPIVVNLKAGDTLVLTPVDAAMPVIWVSFGQGTPRPFGGPQHRTSECICIASRQITGPKLARSLRHPCAGRGGGILRARSPDIASARSAHPAPVW